MEAPINNLDPTTILFIRHGFTGSTGIKLPGQAKGLHLSDKGEKQAQQLASKLQSEIVVDAVFSSPLERAIETATPIAHAFSLQNKITPELIECDFGDWTGETLDSLRMLPEWQTIQNHPSLFTFPGGESFLQMQTRIVQTVVTQANNNPGKLIALISHADPIKAALVYFLGSSLDTMQNLSIAPCSVSAIKLYLDKAIVLCINQTQSFKDSLQIS